jgi:diguanylate cyclase (GGDEF)-like protein/PAS domain S-box-containing protein
MDEEKLLRPEDQDMPFVSRLLYQFIDEKYRPLLDESSDLMCITDRGGKFIYINKKMADSLGYTKKEMLGMHLSDIVAREALKGFQENAKDFLKTGKITLKEFVLKTKYKGKVYGEMSSMAFYDNGGKYCGAKAVFRDRTEFREMEKLERNYETMLEDGIGSLEHIIFILDKDFRVKWASASISKYFGLDKALIVGEDMRELFKKKMSLFIDQEEAFLKNLLVAYETNTSMVNFECTVASPDKENFVLEHWSYPISHGDLSGGRIEIFRDITAKKKAEETLEYYYKKMHAIMEHAVEGIVELRTDNTIEFTNRSFLSMIGYSEMELLNRELSHFIAEDQRTRLVSIKLIRKAREINFVRKDGTLLYALVSSIPLIFGAQSPHAMCFISDITESKMAANKLRDANLTLRALNDSLLDLSLRDVRTGVYNFRYLNERLAEEIKRAKRYFRPFSIIMTDIDFFKAVNDAYGHSFGDVVLKDFTELLKKTVRETDVVVRAGGEEFVVFMADTDSFGALTVAHKITKAIEKTPLGDEKRRVPITISVGISSYPDEGISDAAGLLDAADAAMYQSKHKGRNRVTVFNRNTEEDKFPGSQSDDSFSFEVLEKRLRNVNLRNEESILETMMPMVREVFRRVGYSNGHLEQFLKVVQGLAASFSLPDKERQDLKRAALLCNLGKLAIPEKCLSKKHALSEAERLLVNEHPVKSAEVIRGFSFLAPLREAILFHHERFDGKGYPDGLKGEAIPLGSRIILGVEVFGALTHARPYRLRAFSKEESLEIIRKESGRQLDPLVVERLLIQVA